jgi:hypothetical protein
VEHDQGPAAYRVAGAVATITMTAPSLGLAAKQALLAAAGRD